MPETIGFIGLGLMGRPMATNLIKAGHALVVHSRSPQPVDALVALGAKRAETPADIARQVTRIITMVPDSPDVEQVLEGDTGVFGALQRGTIIIDNSSIAPAKKAGIDAERMREALLGGFAASRVLEVHGERILKGNFKPGFKTKLFAKDLKIASATLGEYQVAAPIVAVAQQEINARMAAGAAEEDYSGMAKVVLELARLD